MQHRIYRYDDGTIGAVATMAHLNDFIDRGTGYNYFDGTSWAAQPSARIETVRTGWPSYAPWGAAGEIVVAHQSGTTPLIISTRETKGSGAWTQSELYPPTGASGMLWPRMVTNGTDHMNVHVIALTAPTGNGGTVWNDLDGALVYNRSLDGGVSWDGWELLDGMTSAEYLGFVGDAYAWAEPRGNTLAFMLGDSWNDGFVMKSLDNGDTWTKEMIWDCPYDLWTGGYATGDFNCMDGNMALAIGPDDVVHTLIGFMREYGDETGATFFYPWTDGLIYWNDGMDEFPQELDPDWLDENGYMIGWVQDTNVWGGAVTQLAYYYNSMSSIPQIVVDESNQVFAFWSSVTDLLDINNYFLRHIYARASVDGGATWRDYIHYVSSDFLFTWSEIVYMSVAPTSTDKIYFSFQEDGEAGIYLKGAGGAQGQVAITNNNITFSEVEKADIINYDNHFTPVWSGNPYQPMNILLSSATLDGNAIAVGDEIGIYDDDGTGNEICFGVGLVTGPITSGSPFTIIASADDPNTTDIDGFTTGNTILYRAWSSASQTEYSTFQATYNPALDDVFAPLGTSLADVAFMSYITQNIQLSAGWNMMSFYVEPDNMSLLNILQPLVTASELTKAIDEAGGFIQYIPGVGWMNTIGDMANTEGYYIKVTSNTSLEATGSAVATPYNIPLSSGWNIMGYPVDQSQDAITILQPLINNSELIKVINEAGGFIQYIPGVGWMNTIGDFDPGEGYYIKVNANTSLTFGGTTPTWQCGDTIVDPTRRPSI